jgi:hypothetical protein
VLDELKKARLISTRVVYDIETMEVIERDSYEYSGPVELASSVTGTGIATPPAQLVNTVQALVQKYIAPVVGDQVLLPCPTMWAMVRRGKKMAGGALVYPEFFQEETTGGAYYGAQLLNTALQDVVQPAEQQWKFYYEAVVLPYTDIILGRGGYAGVDIVRQKFQTAAGSFMQKLARSLFGVAPQNTALDIDSIDAWIGLTTNVIAGIDRSVAANAFWKPQANVAGGGAVLSIANADALYWSTVFGYDEPDLMVMDNTRYAGFKGVFQATTRFTENIQDKEALQQGFRYHFLFNNCVVLADRNCLPNVAYVINTKYMFPVFHEADYFVIDPWVKPSNQRVLVSNIYLTWNMADLSPRMGGKVTNLL